MSALPCITNSRPGVPVFALSGQGGGGVPANPDLTLSTLTVAETAVVSTLGAGGASLALLSKATEGGVRILGDNGTDPTTLSVANLNVSSINGATPGGGGGAGPDPVVSTLTIGGSQLNMVGSSILNLEFISTPSLDSATIFFQNFIGSGSATEMGYDQVTSSILIQGVTVGGPAQPGKLTVEAEIKTSSLMVSSINGLAPGGGGSGATISSIGLAAPFNSGASTTVIVQEPASPSPPTQFTTMFDLQPNTLYNIAASLNYQFSNSITNSNVYMGMRLTSAPAQVIFSPPEVNIGYGNVQGFAPSWTFATGNSTISGVQMDLLLQFENNVSNVSSFITPPTTEGYAVTLTTLGARPT